MKKEKDNWIPVEKKMPPIGQEVRGYIPTRMNKVLKVRRVYANGHGGVSVFVGNGERGLQVTKWKPIG